MDIQQAPGIVADKAGTEDAHEAGQHHQFGAETVDGFYQCPIEAFPVGKQLVIQGSRRNPGCSGALGCFRVLQFSEAPDGKRVARGGDGWVLAVEFTPVPRAYSVLAYGQSARPESPYYADQAAMFARGEMKRVAFTPQDVEKGTVRRYRPGK